MFPLSAMAQTHTRPIATPGRVTYQHDRRVGQLQVCRLCNRVFYCNECELEHRYEDHLLPSLFPPCGSPRLAHPATVGSGIFIPTLELATCPHLNFDETVPRAQRILNWLNLARNLLLVGFKQLPQFRRCLRLRLAVATHIDADLILRNLRPFLGPQPLGLPGVTGEL